MTTIQNSLAMIDGKLCVRTEYGHYSTPTIRAYYHPVVRSLRMPRPGDVLRRVGNHSWDSVDSKTFVMTGSVRVDGTAQAVRVDEIDVPCPKVRKGIETRWYNGAWQKRLKAGWVNV